MRDSLSGKVAIVTGASSGIGWAVAEELSRLGAAVVAQARRGEKLAELAKAIKARGGKVLAVTGDAAKEVDVDTLVNKAVAFSKELGQGGRIDIAIANAGRGLAGGLLGSDDKQWEEMFKINVLGASMLMRRVGAIMAAQESGDIVVIGSVAGHNVSPFSGFYGGSKFAIGAITEGFRREVCAKKVRVTLIKPAIVESEFQQVAGYNAENFYRNIQRFGKLLGPSDVAKAIVFVLIQPPQVHINDLTIRPTGQDYP